jgi:ABC-type phosphate transport system substrate-binding protein
MAMTRPLLLCWALVLLLYANAWAAGNQGVAISVIVAPEAAHPALSHEELALIFKRKKRFWEDGSRIQPVNLPAAHPLRRAFSQDVFGRSPEDLDDYWRDMYFHGELPPYVLNSEEAVIRFVADTPGAIGYVTHCLADHRVSVIAQLDNGPACPR